MTWASDSDIIGVTNNTTKIFSSGLAGENMGTNQTVNVGLNLDTKGMDAGVAKSEKIHKNLAAAAQALSTTQTPSSVVAARQGVAAQSGSYAKGMPSGTNLSRGIAGATGAEGRDFAKQAQGLGGLVHVYATFAANLFAVSAAFGALKAAADTTNMVKGLDQLGAASGMALGSLSKRLVTATDGAISLREAMEATAKASSSGMSSTQILRMGDAAKKASQALGVDMSDAVSRLSRGITKLEPELLDELGIFVRIDDVVKNYATSVGKSALALTDFERRQAFANAVLDQAEKKFSAIDIDANPYAKILASMKDIAQTGLELVNKVFGPLLSILSSSPTALATAMAGIAALLLKQAVPALGMFKENLQQAAKQAEQLALIKSIEAQKGYKAIAAAETTALVSRAKQEYEIAKQTAEDVSEAKVAALVQAENKIRAMSKRALGGKETKTILGKDTHTQEDVDKLNNIVKVSEQQLDQAIQSNNTKATKMLQNRIEAHKIYASTITSYLKDEVEYEEKVNVAKDNSIALQKKYQESENSRVKELLNNRSILNTDRQTQIIAERALVDSASRTIIAQSAESASVKGLAAAWKEAKASIAKAQSGPSTTMMDLGNKQLDEQGNLVTKLEAITTPAMGKIRGVWVLTRVAITSTTSAIGTFMNFLGPWAALIGVVVAAGGALISWMSNTKEEAAATSAALERVTESGKSLYSTLELISKKPVLEQLNLQSISAKATAISDLAESMRTGFTNAFKELDKMQGVDIFTNWFSKLWDGDVESKITDTISRGIFRSFQGIDQNSAAGKAAADAIKKILNVKDLDSFSAISDALDSMTKGERRTAIDLLTKSMQNFGKESLITAAKGVELQAAFAKVAETSQKLVNEFAPKDSLSNYGNSLIDTYFKLNLALEDPIQKLNAINELAAKSVGIKMPTDFIAGVQSLAKTGDSLQIVTREISYINKEITATEAKIAKLQKMQAPLPVPDDIAKMQARRAAVSIVMPKEGDTPGSARNRRTNVEEKELQSLEKTIISLRKNSQSKLDIQVNLKATLDAGTDILKKSNLEVFKAGAEVIGSRLSAEWAKGGAAVAGVVAGILGGTEAGIKLAAQNEKNALALQAEQIKAQRDHILVSKLNTIALEELSIATARLELEQMRARKLPEGTSPESAKLLQASIDRKIMELDKRETESEYKKGLIKSAGSGKGVYNQATRDVASLKPGASAEMVAFARDLEASAAALNAIYGQMSASQINEIDKLIQLKFEYESKSLDIAKEAFNARKATLQITKLTNAETNAEAINEQKLLDIEEVRLQQTSRILAADKEIARFNQIMITKGIDTKNIPADIDRFKDSKKATDRDTDSKILNIELAARVAITKAGSAKLIKDSEYQNELDTRKLAKAKEFNDTQLTVLDVRKDQGIYSEKQYNITKLQLELTKSELDLQQRSNEATRTKSVALAKIIEEENVISTLMGTQEQATAAQATRLAELATERTKILLLDTDSQTRAKALAAIEVERLMIAYGLTEEQRKWNEISKETEDIASSLSSAFGQVGESIGSTLKVLVEMAKTDEEYLTNKARLQKAIDSGSGTDKIAAQEQLTKLNKKQAMSEVSNMASIAGASKKMFAEKTAGYKLLNNIEKLSYAYKAAMQIKDMALDLKAFLAKMFINKARVAEEITVEGELALIKASGSAAQVAADIPAVMSSHAKLGPPGWILGAAAVAALLAMVGGGGKGAPALSTAGLTAEDRQSTQGTGMSWVDGKKVENGGGVFGDAEAKSESIKNSLLLIKENSIEGITFDNETVRLLTSIDQNIGSAAKGLYQIPGLRTGSAFGTTEKATSSPGFLGLFASSSSTSIIDSGIQLEGTFSDLAAKGKGVISLFETVSRTKTSSGFFGIGASNKTTISTNLTALPKEQANQISEVFASLTQIFVKQGEQLGIAKTSIDTALSSIPVSVMASLRGLKGADLEKELSSIFSAIADTTATELFPQLTKFREFGEGMAETVTRVLTQHDRVKQAYSSIGLVFKEVTETVGVASQELLDRVTATKAAVAAAEAAVKGFTPVTTSRSVGGGEGDFTVTETSQIDPKLTQALADTSKDAADALKALTDVTGNNTVVNITATDRMVKSLGGLDTYLAAFKTFEDNFLSDTQRFGIKAAALSKEIYGEAGAKIGDKNAGIKNASLFAAELFATISDGGDAIIDTREEFGRLQTAALKATEVGGKFADEAEALSTSLFMVQDNFISLAEQVETFNKASRSLDIAITKESGLTYAATKMEQADQLEELKDNPVLQGKTQTLFDLQDQNKRRDLNIGLLNAEGKSYEVLQIQRTAAIKAQEGDTTAQNILRATYAAEDANKVRDLEISLLNAQGNATEALALTREKELVGTSGLTRTLIEQRHAAEDVNKTRDLEVALLSAQGNAAGALAINRAKELVGMVGVNRQLILDRQSAEDANRTRGLEISLLNAQGNGLASLAATRADELKYAVGVDRQLIIQRHAAEDANKTAEISIRLLNAQHKGTEALNATRAREARSLSVLDLAITQQIWAIEDAESAADKALAVLGKSVDAQKTSIQESIDVLEPMAKFLEEILGTLEDSIKELYGTVDSTVKMTIAASNALIESYVATGNLPTTEKEVKKLTEAIGIAVTATDNNNFATLQEANVAKLTLAAKLSKLQDSSKDQGTTADKQLVAAKAQLKTLDDTYAKAKEQVDALKGLSIEVMSVEDAVKALEATLIAGNLAIIASNDRAAAAATLDAANKENTRLAQLKAEEDRQAELARIKAAAIKTTGTIDVMGPDVSPGYIPNNPKVADLIVGPSTTASTSPTSTSSNLLDQVTVGMTNFVKDLKDELMGSYRFAELTKDFKPFLDLLVDKKLGSSNIAALFNPGDAAIQSLKTYAATQGIQGFASGGDHEGGLRLVGENGPEIEATGPSRIFNASQARGMLQPDNSELIAEIRLLRKEVQDLKAVNAASSEYNKTTSKQLTRWDVDGMPPERT